MPTRAEKLLERFRTQPVPPDMRFADVKLILEVCGWEEDRSTGHIQFVKPGYRTLPVQVKDGKVGFHVLKQIKRAIA